MKRTIKFIDEAGKRAIVDVEIKDGTFSASGDYDGSSGQCLDSIQPKNEEQKGFLALCAQWHLNDLNAGTPEQEKVLKLYKAKNKITSLGYEDAVKVLKSAKKYIVKHEGANYKYGSAWLTVALPADIEAQVNGYMDRIEALKQIEGDNSNSNTTPAQDFLNNTGATLAVEYSRTGKHFEDDKEERDIYKVTISKGGRSMSFDFGQSINASGKYIIVDSNNGYLRGQKIANDAGLKKAKSAYVGSGFYKFYQENKSYSVPSAYDVLACLQKYEVGNFENFCQDFGYDTDSRKAEKVYKAVLDEYKNLCTLFDVEEMQQLQEIN